ncbi:tetratricopeptide repeat protein [Streptomyces hydrogenans]|uniref:Tetratricopeptide repeat protein 38 family protein n=1 Tax=Streptomyces hydrogenans TaxID=1873719 RepID=A0ABQ3PCE2_9ACTN|nr:tetratricopeptide repeat protein [Streptomyces hydrogenans]GHG39667.1 tetratricopeptide repeat protein 38 family protein [Streptomyces hydrogenans]GHI22667.1 tetratricopeptide repeat protein 38 family protein [Streptomyces hydrogenans]
MATDRYGNTLHGCTPEGAAHLDRAVEALLFFRPEVAPSVEDALAASPGSPDAQAFAAYLGVLGTEHTGAAGARERFGRYLAGRDTTALPARERLHLAAAEACLAGDLHGAGDLLEELSLAHPRDALALFAGHQLDFLTGDAVRLRDRIGGALSAWGRADEHRGPLLGMYAFGLEESGHYRRAEEAGLAAVERHPRDVWAVHAVTHTYEMQGRVAEGVAFLDGRAGDWARGNYLTVHNWWHYALYALEAGAEETALRVYDAAVHHEESAGLAMELLDAAALLWRLRLAGREEPDRWARLADAWAGRADPPFYAFNDAHAVMAYVGAGRIAEAEALVADRRRWLAEGVGDGARRTLSNHAMTAEVGLPVCEALVAHGRGDHGAVVGLLWPVRRRLQVFGGSHAQRDAVQRTLLDSALAAGEHDRARLLLSERDGLRPDSPYNWLGRARLADAIGDAALAAVARERAADATKGPRPTAPGLGPVPASPPF